MQKRVTGALVAMLATISLSLAGCGGGSSTGSSGSAVSGVAAVGLALTGTASLKDSSTPAKSLQTTLNSDGSFTFNVTGMQAPFILEANGTAGGTAHTLYSMAVTPGTANINPLSNMALAGANGGVDPAVAFASPTPAMLQNMATNLPANVAALETSLKPLFTLYGVTTDPITGPFVANQTGLDAMLDAVTMTLSAGTVTVANAGTTAVIFTCPAANIGGGTFTSANMPTMTTPAPTPTPTPTVTVPAAPTGVTATGGSLQVTLSWAAVSGATSYNVYYSTTSGVTTATGTKIAGAATPYVQTGLTAGTTYYYIVTAVNSAGEGTASTQASAVTAAATPAFDALTFFNGTCLGCHSSPFVRTAAQITSAIGSVGSMSQFRSTGSNPLTAAQISAIAAVSH